MTNSLLPFLWFLAILCLIPLALWLLKRTPMGGAGAGGMMRVVSTLPISPSQRLQIVEVGQGEARQWLVLGITGQQIHTLHVMPPQAETPGAAQQASFAQLLASKLKGEQRGDQRAP
ncbi:flagellar biosynthetic protein FliO [Paucibacter sp. R3-3]|uniref:Flagellar biosynthetic protein FliO n=1 Tax=Roseateles agri TaxID=3098619 RepID=A0ABU5DQN0_9BURK|nr:flagellar biosynthetic protein FliO [Paucibacter sp. R3-3]MDY0748419.1 flagellar biosynthetic protein FliO [Paucibacter sp. R3-3]